MVVDTSAITAILANEADAESLEKRLLADPVRLISAATFLELTIVIEGKFGEAGAHEFNTWFELAAIDIVPVDYALADVARHAWAQVRQGAPCRGAQLRRLLFLCPGQGQEPAPAV